MSREFDPYHRWLGIPSEDQPADHYRLLGLSRFEHDVEVIRDAAERQMGHVRRYGLGIHSDLSQRILNELGAAKACLLDPAKRAEYDAELSKKLATPPPLVAAQVPPQQPPILVHARALEPPVPPQTPVVPSNDADLPTARGAESASRRSLTETTQTMLLYLVPRRAASAARRRLSETRRTMLQYLAPQRAESAARRKSLIRRLWVSGGVLAGCALLVIVALVFVLPRWKNEKSEKNEPSTDESASGVAAPGSLKAGVGEKQSPVEARKTSSQATPQPPSSRPIPDKILEVRPAARPPVLARLPDRTVKAGDKAVCQARLLDRNPPPYNLVYSLRDKPPWVRIDKASGTITCQPPESQESGPYRMSVRVASEEAESLYDEKPLTVVVVAPTPPPGPAGPAAGPTAIETITLPFGKTLSPSAWEVKTKAIAAARDMIDQFSPASKVIPVFLGEPGGRLLGLSEYQRSTWAFDGRTITFHPEKDPFSCREAMLRRFQMAIDQATSFGQAGIVGKGGLGGRAGPVQPGLGTLRRAGDSLDPEAFWRDVRLETYVDYIQGNRQGVLATWDAEGRKLYCGQYLRDERHDFCCLFRNDQPAIVLVCDRGKVGAVHLIANGKVDRSFANEEEAQRDATARRFLDEANEFESRFKRNERAFEAQIKKTIQTRMGEINKQRRAMDQSRRSARDAKQKENLKNLRKAATGR